MQQQQQQQQQHNYGYQQGGFQPQKTAQQNPIGHPQYPPNMYSQPPTQQHYMQSSAPGFQHPGGHTMGGAGGGFFPSHTAPTSNAMGFGGVPGEYSDNDREFEKIIEHIANLKYPEKREEALGELSKKRESFHQLAVYLWHSVGTLAIL
jgi:hypothetical protein